MARNSCSPAALRDSGVPKFCASTVPFCTLEETVPPEHAVKPRPIARNNTSCFFMGWLIPPLQFRDCIPPRVYSALAFLDEFHGHLAQLGISPTSSQERPPIVKIDLHRSPHGDPSGNRKALPHYGSPSARFTT